MTPQPLAPAQVLVRRIFVTQVSLIAVTSLIFIIALEYDLGMFWFAFIAGIFGASVALQRTVNREPDLIGKRFTESWTATLSPFLYGAILATVAYFLFLSKLLSGDGGNGLFTTNLFPNFNEQKLADGELFNIRKHFLALRPKSIVDAGKLLIWCFIAGYSETFVTNVLDSLEKKSGETEEDDPVTT